MRMKLPETAVASALVAAAIGSSMRLVRRVRDEWLIAPRPTPGLRAARLMTGPSVSSRARRQEALRGGRTVAAGSARHIRRSCASLQGASVRGDWDAVLKLLRTLNKRGRAATLPPRQIKTLCVSRRSSARGDDPHR